MRFRYPGSERTQIPANPSMARSWQQIWQQRFAGRWLNFGYLPRAGEGISIYVPREPMPHQYIPRQMKKE